MENQWLIVATIVGPVAAVVISAIVINLLQLRPRLFTWYHYTTTVTLPPVAPAPEGAQPASAAKPIVVNTHAFVVRNEGKLPAHNVSVSHYVLPAYSVAPPVPHRRDDLPAGGVALIFPTLAPKEQVTITYLYFPPLIWSQINAGVRSDEVVAQPILVAPARQFSPWALRAVAVLFYMGVALATYLLVRFAFWISTLKHS